MDAESHVTFVERGGPGARAALALLRERALRDGTPARLLASRDQPDLHLLVIEGDVALTEAERHGARVWRFRADRGEAGAETDAATEPAPSADRTPR